MQSFLNGADCSTNANPLNQVLKREGVDNSLYRDRSSGPSSSNYQAPFRATQLPQHLLPSSSSTASTQARPHSAFNLNALAQELTPSASPQQWAHSFRPLPAFSPATRSPAFSHAAAPAIQSDWAATFENQSAASVAKGKQREYDSSPAQYQPSMGMGMGMGMQRSYMPPSTYAHAQPQPQIQREPTAQDFDEAEALAAESVLAPENDQNEAQVEADEPLQEHEKGGDFDAVWESLRPEAERLGKLAEWEAEFSQFVENDPEAEFDTLGSELQNGFADVGQASLDEQFEVLRPGFDIDQDGMPRRVAYEFDPQNPFVAKAGMTPRPIPSASSLISQTDRALALEAQILRRLDPSSTLANVDLDSIPTWCELGKVQGMNEKEALAMRAYESAMDVFDAAVENGVEARVLQEHRAQLGEMMVALAISYTNESLDLAALRTLHRFLKTLHPSFAGPEPQNDSSNPWAPHALMTEAFLALARSQYASQQHVDPDVQVALGVLYFMIGNFQEAKGCWQAALEERPQEFLLWNRLGATLANDGHPEQAIDAYRRALELNPTYTRAIYNLGVSCLNIGVYKEAAEHFLAGLSLHLQPAQAQASAKGLNVSEEFANQSGSLWAVLRRALVGMDRADLADRAVVGAELDMFRAEGFEF